MLLSYPLMRSSPRKTPRKPLIGITASTLVDGIQESGRPGETENAISQAYVDAVEAAGGIPLIVPLVHNSGTAHDILRILDGLLLSGGGDIDPGLYGQEPHRFLKVVDVRKDRLETALLQQALRQDMPVLGICRGMQVLNVAAGGTLIQDIPSSAPSRIQHSQHATSPVPTHKISVGKGSLLARILGQRELRVNSYHHQAVDRVAPGFTATAKASDGIVECIESRKHKFVLGVQFHPEMIFREYPVFQKLFEALVRESCA